MDKKFGFLTPIAWDRGRIFFGAALCFLPFLGNLHLFDWDEINFAESAREMLVSGDYLTVQIGFEPFWEKPPLFLWLQALCMKIFGVGEFAARLPNAIFGIATVLLCYECGHNLRDRSLGWLWALAYWGSLLPHLYAKSGIMDPVFNFFIFGGIFCFFKHFEALQGNIKSAKWLVLAGLSCSLAVLTKGPVALLVSGLCIFVYWALGKFREPAPLKSVLAFVGLTLFFPAVWFSLIAIQHGNQLVVDFFVYQVRLFNTEDAGHGGFPGYHVVVLLLGCFPASVLALPQLFGLPKKETVGVEQQNFARWMLSLFWVVLVLFSVVGTKIVHYSSLCYFPLTYFAAQHLYQFAHSGQILPSWQRLWLLIQGGVMAILVVLLPILAAEPELIAPLFKKDPFAQAALFAPVTWGVWRAAGGFVFLLTWILALRGLAQGTTKRSIGQLFLSSVLFLQLGFLCLIRPIEQHSQGGAIALIQNVKREYPTAIIAPKGFKSYAHFFYGAQQPGTAFMSADSLLLVPIAKAPQFIITKIQKAEAIEQSFGATRVATSGGYVLLRKE